MRLDFDPTDSPARRAKAWAASMVLTFAALAAVIIAWFLSVTYLMPVIGFGAIVLVAAFGGVLSYGLGRVFDWLVRG